MVKRRNPLLYLQASCLTPVIERLLAYLGFLFRYFWLCSKIRGWWMSWICIATICFEPGRPPPVTEMMWCRPNTHSRCHVVLQQLLCTLTAVYVSLATLLPTQIIPSQSISSAGHSMAMWACKEKKEQFLLSDKMISNEDQTLHNAVFPLPGNHVFILQCYMNASIKWCLADIIHKIFFMFPKEWLWGTGCNAVRRELPWSTEDVPENIWNCWTSDYLNLNISKQTNETFWYHTQHVFTHERWSL